MLKGGEFCLVLVLWICLYVTAEDQTCQFGETCVYSCHCRDGADCHPQTGVCDTGCDEGSQSGDLVSLGWRGPACQIGNVAYHKEASQPGTKSGDESLYGASHAVDGNLNRSLDAGSCIFVDVSHTFLAWWRVDLDDVHYVYNVTVVNRDEIIDLVQHTRVEVETATNETFVCGTIGTSLSPVDVATVTCDPPQLATAVRLTRESGQSVRQSDQLSLCEVQITGYLYHDCEAERNTFGPGCVTACNCLGACDSVDGNCSTGCIAGKYGFNCQQDCADGTWGEDCQSSCGCYDVNEVCHKERGECLQSGCADLFIGSSCNIDKPRFIVRTAVEETQYNSALLRITRAVFRRRRAETEVSLVPAYYIVQWDKDASGSWQVDGRVEETGNTNYTYLVDDLDRGNKYQFRVVPVVVIDEVEYVTYPGPSTPVVVVGESGLSPAVISGIVAVIFLGICIIAIIFWLRYNRRVRTLRRKVDRESRPAPPELRSTSSSRFSPKSILISKHKQKSHRHLPPTPVPANGGITNYGSQLDNGEVDAEYQVIYEPILPVVTRPIKVKLLAFHVKRLREDANGFLGEFQTLPMNPENAKSKVGEREENREKNRSSSVITYDHARVELKLLYSVETDSDTGFTNFRPTDTSNYINASYIRAYKDRPRGYIACQGPLLWTLADMWRLVWQENVTCIVMLTNVEENDQVVCEQYWPSEGMRTYGQFGVTLLKTDTYADYLIRTFTLTHNDMARTVAQFHFTAWPSGRVPEHPCSLLEFMRKVRYYRSKGRGSCLVHCCDGAGRTGTFLAIDYQLDVAKSGRSVDILNYVSLMRGCRPGMVKTVEQYAFIYDALLEAILTGDTAVPAKQVLHVYSALSRVPGRITSRLKREFQVLDEICDVPRNEWVSGLNKENEHKNRVLGITPRDRDRPVLKTIQEEESDYINAVFVDGYQYKREYIVTQMPLPETITDLWRMIYDHQSSTIIVLDDPSSRNFREMPVFWPELGEEALEYPPLRVESTKPIETLCNSIEIRKFKITDTSKPSGAVQIVKQFCYYDWSERYHIPRSDVTTLRLLTMMHKWNQHAGDGPVTVMCRDGARRSGLIVGLSLMMNKVAADKEVDIFHIVKLARRSRKQFIYNMDQYRFLHGLAMLYIKRGGGSSEV